MTTDNGDGVCKHCGQPIFKAPYGPPGEYRWQHMWMGMRLIDGGVWCHVTVAEPTEEEEKDGT